MFLLNWQLLAPDRELARLSGLQPIPRLPLERLDGTEGRLQRCAVLTHFVLETIAMAMPSEDYESRFDTVVRWARFGDLFAYDADTQALALQ